MLRRLSTAATVLVLVAVVALAISCSEDDPAKPPADEPNQAPDVVVRSPRSAGLTPALISPAPTLILEATDPDDATGDLRVRYALKPVEGSDFVTAEDYVYDHPDSLAWLPWAAYEPDEYGTMTFQAQQHAPGPYILVVQAADPAGAVSELSDDNVRRVRLVVRSSGPLLNVFNEHTGTIVTSVCNPPQVIVPILGGVVMAFEWTASAEAYGGIVTGYRYGWDIEDVDDDEQWDIGFIPFTSESAHAPPRTFFAGSHTFHVEVRDQDGFCSRVEVRINVVQYTAGRELLIVDDYSDGAGFALSGGFAPSDAEHDAFWEEMVGDVDGFRAEFDVLDVVGTADYSWTQLADYKTIVWVARGGIRSGDANTPLLYRIIRHRPRDDWATGKVEPNFLAQFLEVGGNLLIVGDQPMSNVINRGLFTRVVFPFIFRYELDGDQDSDYADQLARGRGAGELSFAYREACLNVLDYAYPSSPWLRTQLRDGCGVDGIRTPDPTTRGLRAAHPIEFGYPRLELRWEVALPGKAYAPENKGLNAELYNPSYFAFCPWAELDHHRDCFQPIYGLECLEETAVTYGSPVAFRATASDGRCVVFGVPLVYFEPGQAREAVERILFDDWGLPRKP